ncbi:MAG: transcription termination factor NusA [bacterium]
MIEIDNLDQVASQIESERGIPKEVLFSAIEQALVSACRKKYNEEADITAKLDTKAGKLQLFFHKIVVEEVSDDTLEISLKDAQKINPQTKLDEMLTIELKDPDFGRYAAQVARQVIIQRLREEEKGIVYDHFKSKEGQLIQGTVQSVEPNYYLMNLGMTEAILSKRDCIPNQNFFAKETIKFYLVSIEKTQRRPNIYISRTHSGFLEQLLIQEIPELQDGIIEIKAVSRQAGERAKVAVVSHNPSIGAVGTCVGPMGGRIQTIIEELGGKERIDILEWNENIKTFISNSLKPAKISQVIVLDEEKKSALVVTENDQLSLAIGKQGQNVRLSSRLTGWQLDVVDEATYEKDPSKYNPSDTPLSLAEKMSQSNESETDTISEDDPPATPALSLAEKIALSKNTSPDVAATDSELISVAALAKELKFKTATALIEAIDRRVTIANTRAKLSAELAEKIRELFTS